MKKQWLLFAVFASLPSMAAYNAIISKSSINFDVKEPVLMKGYLINLTSINNAGIRDQNDVTKTSNPLWEENFSMTKDLVINQVTTYNSAATKTGVINWFDPKRTYQIEIQEACMLNDRAHVDLQLLDETDTVLFWLKSRSKSDYGSIITYGKAADYSDVTNAPYSSAYPIMHGNITFNTNTISYKNSSSGNYSMQDWSLSGIDVDKIKKIRVSSSNVVSSYSGTTCGTQVRLKLI